MQVTPKNSYVTHAVIGGRTAKKASIAATPEFFRVLSRMYSDIPKAVVQETLCNAWDIHVETGRTDIPLEITVTEEGYSVRDFGTGIPDEDIEERYLTYGLSTKTQDEAQTGGFGLGCKSPWAFVEHFEVTSFNAGQKTIYNMALSSAVANGQPSAIPMVTTPTEETGLQVSIKFDNPYHRTTFERLVRRIVLMGGMNAKLNGEFLPVLPFEKFTDGFVILPSSILDRGIHIRYGHVVYPLRNFSDIRPLYDRATRIVSDARSYGNESLVLQAKPGSLTITPSRESLEMTEQTEETVRKLLEGFIEGFERVHEVEARIATQEAIQSIWLNSAPGNLLEPNRSIPNLRNNQGKLIYEHEPVWDFRDISRAILCRKYPENPNFESWEIRQRLDALVEAGFDKTGLIKNFRMSLKGEHVPSNWFHKKLIWPLLRDLDKTDLLNSGNLLVNVGNRCSRTYLPKLFKPKEVSLPGTRHYLPFLRGIVVLTHNRNSIYERAPHFPVIKHWLKGVDRCLVYTLPRNKYRQQAAYDFFTKRGFTVIDLTRVHPWEESVETTKSTHSRPRKKVGKGLPLLSSMISPEGKIEPSLAYHEDAKRTETPEFVVVNGPTADSIKFHCASHAVDEIIRIYGHLGGVAANSNQLLKYVDKGAKRLDKWLPTKLKDEFITNSSLQTELSIDLIGQSSIRNEMDPVNGLLWDVILSDEELRKFYKLPPKPGSREKSILAIWSQISTHYKKRDFKDIVDYILSLKLNKNAKKLNDQINASLGVSGLSPGVRSILYSSTRREQKDAYRKLIIAAIKG